MNWIWNVKKLYVEICNEVFILSRMSYKVREKVLEVIHVFGICYEALYWQWHFLSVAICSLSLESSISLFISYHIINLTLGTFQGERELCLALIIITIWVHAPHTRLCYSIDSTRRFVLVSLLSTFGTRVQHQNRLFLSLLYFYSAL